MEHPILPENAEEKNSPQTRHRLTRAGSDNGGFLRVSEDWFCGKNRLIKMCFFTYFRIKPLI